MNTPVFQHAYSVPFRGSDLECLDPSLAQQNFKDEVDINVLLERFKVTGQLPQNVVLPTYGDFTGLSDYQTAMAAVLRAQDQFNALPAEIRSRFANNPQQFLEFCSDEANLPELRKMGLANPLPDKQDQAQPDVAPSGA